MAEPTLANEMGYRLMIGFCGISIGASLALAWHWLRDAINGKSASYWFWGIAMIGFVLHIVAILPLVVQARVAHAAWNWQTWAFFIGVTLETIAYVGLFIRRTFLDKRVALVAKE